MLRVAGAEQHHIDPGLMPHKPIGRIGDGAGAAFMDQKAQRVGHLGEPLRNLSRLRQIPDRAPQPLGLGKNVADREHQQSADPVRNRQRKHAASGILVHHVKAEHDDLPDAVGDGAPDRLVLEIMGRGLGDAEMAELALGLFLQ